VLLVPSVNARGRRCHVLSSPFCTPPLATGPDITRPHMSADVPPPHPRGVRHPSPAPTWHRAGPPCPFPPRPRRRAVIKRCRPTPSLILPVFLSPCQCTALTPPLPSPRRLCPPTATERHRDRVGFCPNCAAALLHR
jgi:hypothetical protein